MFTIPDTELQAVLDMLIIPLQRAFVMLVSLRVGSVSLGGLLIVGIIIAILIEVLMHMKGPGVSDIEFRKDNKK